MSLAASWRRRGTERETAGGDIGDIHRSEPVVPHSLIINSYNLKIIMRRTIAEDVSQLEKEDAILRMLQDFPALAPAPKGR